MDARVANDHSSTASSPEDATVAQRLARHFTAMRFHGMPEENRHAVKRLLLDYLGVAIAGSRSDSGRIAAATVSEEGGAKQATLIGNGALVPAGAAAFANAIASHSLELDDVDVLANFHFSPPICSAALAAAETAAAPGKQLIVALAAGCEMMERLSKTANPSLRERNFHTTPTCGVFGAAVAAARLWRLSAPRLVSALGLSGAQASGVLEFQGASMQKRFSPGPAARGAITAVRMAQKGYTGQEQIFEGRRGFLRAYTDTFDLTELTDDLDRPYRLDIEYKPYACARPIHNAIDCAIELRTAHAIDLGSIVRIDVARHPFWASKHGDKAPRNFHGAQLSLPFSVAVALKDGRALLSQYGARNLSNPIIRSLMAKTYIGVDETLPRGVSCRMSVRLKNGGTLVSQVDYPRGSIQKPMSDEEIEQKFVSLSAPIVGAGAAKKIGTSVWSLELCGDTRRLLALCRVNR